MDKLRAAGLAIGVVIGLAGLYVLADGITGLVTAKSDLMSSPQIPLGVIILAVAVFGVLFMEQVFVRQRMLSEPQTAQPAPTASFETVKAKQSQLGQEAPKTVMGAPTQVVSLEQPRTDVVTASQFSLQYPTVQVENKPDQVLGSGSSAVKPVRKSAAKKAAKSALKSKAKKGRK